MDDLPVIQPPQIQTDAVIRAEYASLCQSCGACCSFYAYAKCGLGYLKAEEITPALEPHVFSAKKRMNGETIEGYWMRRTLDKHGQKWPRCKCLRGDIGVDVQCAIYADRPQMCRSFDPGSPKCRQIRQWAGFEAADA